MAVASLLNFRRLAHLFIRRLARLCNFRYLHASNGQPDHHGVLSIDLALDEPRALLALQIVAFEQEGRRQVNIERGCLINDPDQAGSANAMRPRGLR